MTLNLQNKFWSALAVEHRQWLDSHDPQYLANWNTLLKQAPEAAMTEAGVRRMLESKSVVVTPNEEVTGAEQRPDFKCLTNEHVFYVEVTHISINKASSITGLAEDGGVARNPTPLTRAIRQTCTNKAAQCSDQDAPVLLAIGTFHGAAAMFAFSSPWLEMSLAGMTKTSVCIDRQTLELVDGIHQDSELDEAAFLRFAPDSQIEFARSSISGLLLCGLSLRPPWVTGVLHPNPVRPFDQRCLSEVAFGRVEVHRKSAKLRVHWPREQR